MYEIGKTVGKSFQKDTVKAFNHVFPTNKEKEGKAHPFRKNPARNED